MKTPILTSPAFVLFVLAALVITAGFWGLSFSSFEKGDNSFPFLFVLSYCVIGLGVIAAFVSFVVGLVTTLDRWFDHTKNATR